MATCTVTFTVAELAVSEGVKFLPFPFQIIDGVALSTVPINATASGNTYTAVLVQKAIYVIESVRYPFINSSIEIPAAASAALVDLLPGIRKG